MSTLELILAIIIANLIIYIIVITIRLNKALIKLDNFYLSDEEAERIWKEIEGSKRIEEIEILPASKGELESTAFELHKMFEHSDSNLFSSVFNEWWKHQISKKTKDLL